MKTCDGCMTDIEDMEHKGNGGLCFDCLTYSRENECELCTNARNSTLGSGKLCSEHFNRLINKNGKDVKLCDNYVTCGEKANVSMGLGNLCDKCRDVKEVKVVPVKSFISGVHRAFIKD